MRIKPDHLPFPLSVLADRLLMGGEIEIRTYKARYWLTLREPVFYSVFLRWGKREIYWSRDSGLCRD